MYEKGQKTHQILVYAIVLYLVEIIDVIEIKSVQFVWKHV